MDSPLGFPYAKAHNVALSVALVCAKDLDACRKNLGRGGLHKSFFLQNSVRAPFKKFGQEP